MSKFKIGDKATYLGPDRIRQGFNMKLLLTVILLVSCVHQPTPYDRCVPYDPSEPMPLPGDPLPMSPEIQECMRHEEISDKLDRIDRFQQIQIFTK